ncbi:PAS domain-containing protein [Archangium violaceum]|uniref:hybrid sensor histidine kinase/response regulator n=1 Tax=Archangium violaceum TaxID=83451 RepID=UPI00193C59B3|nr:ATP-binding protein [Archangium violaceum]QRK05678.1 PAS domain-containing protein [Archangium violaceum]
MVHEVPHASLLLVDERQESLLALEASLAPLGPRLVTANSAEDALRRFLHEDFALILLDVHQEWEEGLVSARLLREVWRSRSTPLLLLTEEPEPARVREAHALGAVDCLASSHDPDVLRAKVSVFIELHQRNTELRRARVALAEREERLRFILQAGGLGQWRLELPTLRLDASEGCKNNFGLPPEWALSSYEALLSLIHPEDRQGMTEAVERALATCGDYSADYRVVPPGGGLRWVAARGRVECGPDGRPVGMVGITLDITERMRGEQRLGFLSEASRLLTESQEPDDALQRVARLAASSVATYCLVDLLQEDGGFQRVAAAHREPSLEEAIQQARRFTPQSDVSALVAEALRHGWTKLYTDLTPEHRRRSAVSPAHLELLERLDPHSVLLVPMKTRERPWGVITFARAGAAERFDEGDMDMAEELARRAASALENARLLRTTQEAVRLRDEFLSVASHELKTPLTPLSLKLQALARAVKGGGCADLERRLPGEVDVMRRQVKRLSDLVNELLDVSRISSGRLSLALEQVDLTALVREVSSRFEPEAERVGCRLHIMNDGALLGCWDRLRLEQVVSNLLSNSIKYGAGRPIHIQVGASERGARLVIRDEGIGIQEEALSRIFGKFERAVSERNYGGLGLGLYITRQIVEAHGGTIRVESAPGQGATFTLELPLRPG